MRKVIMICLCFIMFACEKPYKQKGTENKRNSDVTLNVLDEFDLTTLPNGTIVSGAETIKNGEHTYSLTFMDGSNIKTVSVQSEPVYSFLRIDDILENGKIIRNGSLIN